MDSSMWQTLSKELISYIHHTNDFRQYCHRGTHGTALWTGLFQDSNCAGDLEDWKSTSGSVLCIFGSRTFFPVSWMCKKQTAVSHSSTESDIISLDAGLRMDGLPALDLWDIVIDVLRSTNNNVQPQTYKHTRKLMLFFPKPRPGKSKESRKLIKMIIKRQSPTCPEPQSWSWQVVRQNQFGTQNLN